jgi:hypothetical protein
MVLTPLKVKLWNVFVLELPLKCSRLGITEEKIDEQLIDESTVHQ